MISKTYYMFGNQLTRKRGHSINSDLCNKRMSRLSVVKIFISHGPDTAEGTGVLCYNKPRIRFFDLKAVRRKQHVLHEISAYVFTLDNQGRDV